MCVAGHAQQNNNFAIFLQRVKKEVSDAVDFLHTEKHESLLQTETKIFWWGWSSIPKVPKIASLQCLYNISKKKLKMKLTFWMQINIKVSYKLISTLWASKFNTRILSLLMGMIKHSQSTQSNNFAISLQYLKKEVRNGVHFLHADKHQSFYKLDYCFWWK